MGVRKMGDLGHDSLDPDEPKAMAACGKVDDVDCKYFKKKGKKYKVACGCWVGGFFFLELLEGYGYLIWYLRFLPVRIPCEQKHRIYRYTVPGKYTTVEYGLILEIYVLLQVATCFLRVPLTRLEKQSDDRRQTNWVYLMFFLVEISNRHKRTTMCTTISAF